MEVKIEIDRLVLCFGCLSSDRKLTQVPGPLITLFIQLRSEGQETFSNVSTMLCWECIAVLRKISAFKKQVQRAQSRLIENTPYYCTDTKDDISLSHLTTVCKNNYDYAYNYNDQITKSHLIQTVKIPTNLVIKEENNTYNEIQIKLEELTSNDNNADFDDKDNNIKLTTNDGINVKDKKDGKTIKKDNIYYQSIKTYVKYATISKKNLEFNSGDIEKYYKIVYLSENEYETYLKCKKSEKLTSKCKKAVNKCVECPKAYLLPQDLMRHKALNHDTSSYPRKCTSCKTVITTQNELTAHWRQVHTVMVQCTLCEQVCRNTDEVRKHLNRTHTSYICNVCNMDIPTLRQFSVHYRETHQRCVCDYCQRIFFEKRKLEKHIIRLHLPPYCTICHRSYKSYKLYNRHYVTYHPKTIENDKKDLSYCVECDRQFSTVHFYKKHLKESVKHKQRKKLNIPCPDCGKTFTKRANMKNHYDAIHKHVTRHHCTICDKYLSTGNAVRTHIANVHHKVQMPKNKICDLCGRGFTTKRILDNHRRTHTGERPFKCQYCPSSFAQMSAMKTHQKTQHKNISFMSNNDGASDIS